MRDLIRDVIPSAVPKNAPITAPVTAPRTTEKARYVENPAWKERITSATGHAQTPASNPMARRISLRASAVMRPPYLFIATFSAPRCVSKSTFTETVPMGLMWKLTLFSWSGGLRTVSR